MPTILCVDDEPTQLTLLEFTFRRAKMTVLKASNGKEAIEQTQAHHPDLILMDLMMPIMDGATATVAIKNDPALSDIPIVLFTAYETGNMANKAMEAGAIALIAKTTSPRDLIAKIEEILSTTQ